MHIYSSLKSTYNVLIFHLTLHFYEHNMLAACQLMISYLLSSEQYPQFEKFHQQHAQMVNKTSSFETKLIIGNNEARRVNCNTLWCVTL